MIELRYNIDDSLGEGEARIHPATRRRIGSLERYTTICQSGLRIGRGERTIEVTDDPSCGADEIRVSPIDQQALKLERAVIDEGPLPQGVAEGLTDTERIEVTFLAITRSAVGEESGSGPLLTKLQAFAATGRVRAFTESLQIYLGIVPAASGFVQGRPAGIISTRYLAGYLHLDPQRLSYWLRHNQDLYERLIDMAQSPLSRSFETVLDAVALLVELGT